MGQRSRDQLYRLVAAGLQAWIWGGEVVGAENLPAAGPAVLVGNHLGALGPIAVAACVPRRLYPWVVSDMLENDLAAEYLRVDFVERTLRLGEPVSRWLAAALAKITVPLLTGVGCVPVYADPERRQRTLTRTADLLERRNFILVFPEDPARPVDSQLGMAPFKKGFARLGELYYQRCQACLPFHPVAIEATRRLVQVGQPLMYNPASDAAAERLRIKTCLERSVREMLLDLRSDPYMGVVVSQ